MNELKKVEPTGVAQTSEMSSREQFLLAAMDKAKDADQLEKMLAIQERWERNQAEKAYVKAMAEFKASPPKIVKDRSVSFNQTSYKHATLSNVTDKVNTALASHGLSASWRTNHKERNICVTCVITHEMGHSESTTMCALPDDSGKKNAIQQIGSTVTYLQRYTLLAMCGLAAFDDDDAATVATINDEQIADIKNMIGETLYGEEKQFLDWVGVETVEDMTEAQYKKAVAAIEDIKRNKA